MRVSRWGDSLAVRLPAELVKALNLKEGDEVSLTPDGEGNLALSRPDPAAREAALKRLESYVGLIGKDIKFNRDEANER